MSPAPRARTNAPETRGYARDRKLARRGPQINSVCPIPNIEPASPGRRRAGWRLVTRATGSSWQRTPSPPRIPARHRQSSVAVKGGWLGCRDNRGDRQHCLGCLRWEPARPARDDNAGGADREAACCMPPLRNNTANANAASGRTAERQTLGYWLKCGVR